MQATTVPPMLLDMLRLRCIAAAALVAASPLACRRASLPDETGEPTEPSAVASRETAPPARRHEVAAASIAPLPQASPSAAAPRIRDEAKAPAVAAASGAATANTAASANASAAAAVTSDAPEPPRPAAPFAPVVRGTVVSTDHYSAYLQTTGRYVTGSAGALLAVVVAKGEYECNEEYPTRFTAAHASGVGVGDKVVRGSLAGRRGALSIPIQIIRTGPASVGGELRFSVCSPERCLLEKQSLELSFDVE